MKRRENSETKQPFWGCPGWPDDCNGTRPISETDKLLAAGAPSLLDLLTTAPHTIDVSAIQIAPASSPYSIRLDGSKDTRPWCCSWNCPTCETDRLCTERAVSEAAAKALAVEIAQDARCYYCRKGTGVW